MHLIAMRLKKHFDIPWVADFRDPWTEIYYYEDLKLSRLAHREQCRLEHNVLQKADKVVTVSQHCALGLERHGAKEIKVIPNGYDGDCNRSNLQANGFILSHIGIIPPKTSPVIWEAIGELIKEHKEFSEHFQLRLVGQIDNSIKELLIKYGVSAHTEFVHYLPHDKMPEMQRQSHVLLLLIPHIADARGIVTGKFYEYLQARRPILGIGPENGDAATILKATRSGLMIDFTDKSKMKEHLLDLFSQYQQDQLSVLSAVGIENYSRKVLAGEYVTVLENVVAKKKICHLAAKHKLNDMRAYEKECKSLASNGFDVTLIGFGEHEHCDYECGVKRIWLHSPIKNNLEILTKRNPPIAKKSIGRKRRGLSSP